MTTSRRNFLAASASLTCLAGTRLTALAEAGTSPSLPAALAPLKDEITGLALLRLPADFSYRSFGWTGDLMSDDVATPGNHDGMAVVQAQGDLLTLVRNHEIVNDRGAFGPPKLAYDRAAGGGTTHLQFDTAKGEFVRAWASLSGTLANCCGGPTPWGSWLTCEERVMQAAARVRGSDGQVREVAFRKDHGYVFEVPAQGMARVEPLVDMGCFAHEAAAVDPEDGCIYLTEDRRPEAGLYRFQPARSGDLAAGGRLHMMQVVGQDDLRRDVTVGKDFDVRWVEIEEPGRMHSPGQQDAAGVVTQGLAAGGSKFLRLEGCWYDSGRIFFTSTSGGTAGCGQVFCLNPSEQTLTLLYESPSRQVLDSPDNVTVAPNGAVLLCEDGSRQGQMITALTPQGQLQPLVQNNTQLKGERNGITGDYRSSEWCGACFSPDGQWLFANLQRPGITFAITGPWRELLG